MYVCIYVCMYICIYVCVYVSMYVCMIVYVLPILLQSQVNAGTGGTHVLPMLRHCEGRPLHVTCKMMMGVAKRHEWWQGNRGRCIKVMGPGPPTFQFFYPRGLCLSHDLKHVLVGVTNPRQEHARLLAVAADGNCRAPRFDQQMCWSLEFMCASIHHVSIIPSH